MAEIDEWDTHQIIVIGVAAIVLFNAMADSVMDEISRYIDANTDAEIINETRENRSEALSGVAFAATHDRLLGKGLWIRLFAGHLENRVQLTLPGRVDPLTGEPTQVQSKITQIRDVSGVDKGNLSAGDIGVIYGLGQIKIGQVVGNGDALPRKVRPGTLLMTVRVVPDKQEKLPALEGGIFDLEG